MHIDLTGRTALVTGGSRGIGRAIAERLGRSGADVVIVARRSDVIEETVAELKGVVAGAIAGYSCDVSNAAEIDRVFATISEATKGIDILVNNAGSSARSLFLQMDRALLDADLDLKLHAAVRFSQLVLPQCKGSAGDASSTSSASTPRRRPRRAGRRP